MAPIRQKLRPGVADFLARCVESSRWRGFPSRGGDAKQPVAVVGTKQNHAVAIPCSVPRARGNVADGLWRAAAQINSFEFSIREKPDGAAVRRPEWMGSALSP